MATLKSSAKKSPEVTAPQGLSRGEREAAKRARKLRRQTSEDEQKLWHQLRDKQLDGFRFKRQRSIGKYIVDFVSDEAKLIIELRDQMPDSNPIEKARAAYFKAQGYLVLHMLNNEVTASIKTGLEAIRKHLRGEDVVPEETVKSKKAAAPKVAKKLAADREPESAVEMTAKAALPAKKVAAKKTVAKKVVAKTAATESEAVESTIKTKSVVKTATTKKPAAKKPAVKKLAAKNKAEESGA